MPDGSGWPTRTVRKAPTAPTTAPAAAAARRTPVATASAGVLPASAADDRSRRSPARRRDRSRRSRRRSGPAIRGPPGRSAPPRRFRNGPVPYRPPWNRPVRSPSPSAGPTATGPTSPVVADAHAAGGRGERHGGDGCPSNRDGQGGQLAHGRHLRGGSETGREGALCPTPVPPQGTRPEPRSRTPLRPARPERPLTFRPSAQPYPSACSRSSSMPKWWAISWTTVISVSATTSSRDSHIRSVGPR